MNFPTKRELELTEEQKIFMAPSQAGEPRTTWVPPANGTHWRHHSGRRYRIIEIANLGASPDQKDKFPPTIVYQGEDGKVWATTDLGRWYSKFALV